MNYNQSCAAKGSYYGNRPMYVRSMQRAAVNIFKTENSYEMLVFAPGRLKEHFHLSMSGNELTVKMVAVRSSFEPNKVEVQQGDKVTIYLTNIEQTTDELHGFGLNEHNINVVVDPGETKTIEFVADKTGVFPYYCTNFCSALHQEMQGYLLVKPKS